MRTRILESFTFSIFIFSILAVTSTTQAATECEDELEIDKIIECMQKKNREKVVPLTNAGVTFSKRGMSTIDTAKSQELLLGGQ